mgnify:CR=1 FL=1
MCIRDRALAVLVAVLAMAACTNDESALDTKPISVGVTEQPPIAALVPAAIRDGGVLIVGTNPPYQPNEFKNRDGAIIGFDIDLVRAISQVFGLQLRVCLLYTSPSPRDRTRTRMPSSA